MGTENNAGAQRKMVRKYLWRVKFPIHKFMLLLNYTESQTLLPNSRISPILSSDIEIRIKENRDRLAYYV